MKLRYGKYHLALVHSEGELLAVGEWVSGYGTPAGKIISAHAAYRPDGHFITLHYAEGIVSVFKAFSIEFEYREVSKI